MTAAVAAAARDWNERARGQLRAVRCFPMETESLWLVFFFWFHSCGRCVMVNIICLLGPVNAAVHGVHIETFFFIILYSCCGGGYCYYLCDRLICDHWLIRTCCTIDMKCEQIEMDAACGIVFFFILWENIVVISKDGEGASGECLHFRQNGNLLIGRVRNPS